MQKCINESKKDDPEWDKCIKVFSEAMDFAKQHGNEWLLAGAARGIIVVYDEYLDDGSKALQMVDKSRSFPHEVDSLIEATKQTRAKFYLPAIIYLGAEHGAAKQEILSLKWSKIDFDYNGIGLITLYRTKTKTERTDSLMPRTKQALLDWRDHLKWMRHRKKIENIQTDFVFCHLDGSPIKNFNNAWWRSLEIAGIQDFHFHDLRHTFCSNLILSGAGLKEVKEMIGHKDIAMTDRYSHLTDEHKSYRQNLLADHYESKN